MEGRGAVRCTFTAALSYRTFLWFFHPKIIHVASSLWKLLFSILTPRCAAPRRCYKSSGPWLRSRGFSAWTYILLLSFMTLRAIECPISTSVVLEQTSCKPLRSENIPPILVWESDTEATRRTDSHFFCILCIFLRFLPPATFSSQFYPNQFYFFEMSKWKIEQKGTDNELFWGHLEFPLYNFMLFEGLYFTEFTIILSISVSFSIWCWP